MSYKILIVDDDSNVCKITKRNLESKHYEVEVALGGEEAITKIYDFSPNVVILDVMMPRLSGDELVKMIKAWKPEVQVIMVSAVAKEEIEGECLRNGAFGFLRKPVDFQALKQMIQNAIATSDGAV